LSCFSQNKKLLAVLANHSRYRQFARQAIVWGRNDHVCRYRLWLAKTAETFHGSFGVLFWLRQNSFEPVSFYFSFVLVSFQFNFNCADSFSCRPAYLQAVDDTCQLPVG